MTNGKKGADSGFAKDKNAGSAKQPCKKQAADKKLAKSLEATWDKADAYCGDPVNLLGTAKNFTAQVEGKAKIEVPKDGVVANLKAQGKDSFKLPWKVAELPFKGKSPPAHVAATGTLTADGITAKTKQALAVKRVPDKTPEAVNFKRSSGIYGWDASFRIGIDGTKLLVRQTLQLKKAWLGKWVSFDAKADKLAQGWGFVKKVGTDWKYWNTTDTKWQKLPRDIGKYTVTSLVFVKNGKSYVGRDDATQTWPESFAEPKNFTKKKKAWLDNIHSVWHGKFRLHRTDCGSKAANCCTWDIDVKVDWSDAAGDKLVYAVWSSEWERSDASDWYLSEDRLGVAAHECGHLLGAYDEYTGGAIDPASKKIEDDSIMGQNLTKGFPRHFDGLRDEAAKKINAWIGRSWKFEVKSK
ncbi:MAG: hypothetical protein IT457_20240 [Planctomycetes bacterium]|nr:hypothetical protein [Planctomycetota bacterium]